MSGVVKTPYTEKHMRARLYWNWMNAVEAQGTFEGRNPGCHLCLDLLLNGLSQSQVGRYAVRHCTLAGSPIPPSRSFAGPSRVLPGSLLAPGGISHTDRGSASTLERTPLNSSYCGVRWADTQSGTVHSPDPQYRHRDHSLDQAESSVVVRLRPVEYPTQATEAVGQARHTSWVELCVII